MGKKTVGKLHISVTFLLLTFLVQFFNSFKVCRACMHSFFIGCQSLRELRITSVLRNVAIQKEMWVGSNVTAL
jgi:hypothetical protein